MPGTDHPRRVLIAGGGPAAVETALALQHHASDRVAITLVGPDPVLHYRPLSVTGHVAGVPDVFAVGDMTTRPLKQGGLATQQADATAMTLAAWAGADVVPLPYRPELRAVLLTGGEPRYLHRPGVHAGAPGGVSDAPPWWPPHKIASRHLSPYLAAHPDLASAV